MNPETKFGSFYVGAVFSQILYGVVALQTYFYLFKYPKDYVRNKTLVFALWLIATTEAALTCHISYHYQVTGLGRPQWRSDGVWSIFTSMGLTVAIMVIVQCYFANRIFRMSKPPARWWLIVIIMSLILAQFAFGIQTVTEFSMKKQFSRLREANAAAIPFRVTNVAANTTLTIVFCILLGRRRQERHNKIHLKIDKAITFIAERLLLVTFVSVLELILSLLSPDSFYGAGVDLILGQVYVNTFLVVMNSREPLRGRGLPNISIELTTRSPQRGQRSRSQPVTSFIEMGTIADSSVADIDGAFGLRTSDFRATETGQS